MLASLRQTTPPVTPTATPTPAAPARDIFAVNAALASLDQAVAKAEQAVTIEVPGKGVFGGGKDAHDAAVAERVKLLKPAADAIEAATTVLDANVGYRSQPRGEYGDPLDGGYRVPMAALGDNAHDMVSIAKRAADNPIKYKWVNDFPWQSNPTTTLADMVGYVKDMAGEVTRGEARISLRRVTDMTSAVLYEHRVQELAVPQLQQLQDAIGAVRSLGTSRFADDALRGQLASLPSPVLVVGKLTTDPASLQALEALHRSTVVDAGSAKASANVEAQLARAKELASAGDTAAAREIYERLAAGGAS
jgi:hypothetical protein